MKRLDALPTAQHRSMAHESAEPELEGQKKLRKIYIGAFIGLILFPPFHSLVVHKSNQGLIDSFFDRNTSFVLSPPAQGNFVAPWTVNWGRLLIELAVVAGLATVVIRPRRGWVGGAAFGLALAGGIMVYVYDQEKLEHMRSVFDKPRDPPGKDKTPPPEVKKEPPWNHSDRPESHPRLGPPTEAKPLPAELVEAWEKGGFDVGWMDLAGDCQFYSGKEGKPGQVPAFRSRLAGGPPTAGLPMPDKAFGLYFPSGSVKDETLNELARFKTLQVLTLQSTYTGVTEAGLMAVAAIEQLQSLYIFGDHITDRVLKEYGRLSNLRVLHLSHVWITDAGMQHLAGMTKLQSLNLPGIKKLTDAGLKHLAGMNDLQWLVLSSTGVTDAGLKELMTLTKLEHLELFSVAVTDAGLEDLGRMKNLRYLDVMSTKASAEGVEKLHRTLPECRIHGYWGKKEAEPEQKEPPKIEPAKPKVEPVKPKVEPVNPKVEPVNPKVEPVKPKEEPTKPKEDPLEPLLKNPPTLESIDFFPEAEPKPLPDDIRMAWYRAGATCGWLGLLESQYESDFALTRWPEPIYQVPSFWLDRFRVATPIASLPAPLEKFGLYLRGAFDKTTAGELARFKHLDWLRLSSPSTGSLVELARCPALRSLELLYVNDAHLKELSRLKQLRCVALVGREITDAGLDSLLELPHLEALSINGGMTDAGLRKLAGFKQLRWLRLTGFHFTDGGLAVLLQLPKLQHVQIIGQEVTEAGLRFAMHSPELRRVGYRIGISGGRFSDDAYIKPERIRQLGKLDPLHWLQIRQPRIEAIPEIGALTQLRGLSLDQIVLKPDWKPLGKLTNLETLTLPYGGETDEALAEVGRLKKLHSLTVRGGRVTSKGLAALAGLTNLRSLDLEYARTSDADLKSLESLKQLRSLNLQVTKISDAGLKSLAQLPDLETLNLTSTSISDAGIGELSALKNLRTLSVLNTKVTQAGVKKLAGLEHLLIYYDNRPIEPEVGKPKTHSNSNPEPKTAPAPIGEFWQNDPTAIAGLFFGANLKKRTPDESRDLKYPKDVEKKVAGASIEWIGKVLPGPVSGGKNGKVLVVSAGKDGTILIRGSSGYKDGDRFVTIEEQIQSLPIPTRVKITMKIKTPVNAVIAFDGAPMLVLDGDDARVAMVK